MKPPLYMALHRDPLEVTCPDCNAPPRHPCRTVVVSVVLPTSRKRKPHILRVALAEGQAPPGGGAYRAVGVAASAYLCPRSRTELEPETECPLCYAPAEMHRNRSRIQN